MIKKIFLLFLLLTTLIFSKTYIPRSIEEETYLNNLRTQEITVGLLDNEFYNISSKEEPSLNEIIKDLFQNYLNLNVKFKT
ncbi:MAG: hypothetical protein ACRC7S_01975, partial [Cetobacterium sp.]